MKRVTHNIPAKLSKDEAVQAIRSLPAILAGRSPDRYGYGRMFKCILAHHLFTKIREAYLVKSDGGRDECGESWKPLKRETIANRPLRPGEASALGIRGLGRSGRGLLTAEQNRKWKGIFASTYKRLVLKVGEAEAKRIAGKTAWAILKSMGAKTKLEVLGNRKVPILRVSDRLLESLSPGRLTATDYIPAKEQVFETHQGRVTIGSKVPYAVIQNKRRRIIPPVTRMNRAGWISEGSSIAATQVIERIMKS